jgi:hypothetical protein
MGLGGIFLSKKIICVPFTKNCYFITKGDNMFDAEGPKVDENIATMIASSHFITFPLSGICLLAGLLRLPKSNND